MDATLSEKSETIETDLKTASSSRNPALKPLGELYGTGTGGTVDPQDDAFMPLFMAIESEISRFDSGTRRLTDAEVKLALDAMGMNPEAPSGDDLVQRLQSHLGVCLSLNNYSRQEVRQAIRRIGRSVERHSEGGRGRGYINFIRRFM